MLKHRRPRVLYLGKVALALMALTPASAFEDQGFCAAARQLALAADQDIGLWIDRVTRNAGMTVDCDRRIVEFKRFTYSPSISMNATWKARKAEEWNATHCNSLLWADAIRNGWTIALNLTAADGGHVSLTAQCK